MLHSELYCPKPGYRNFEITLYNRDVRALVKSNQQHRLFADLWADDQITVVEARDADEARSLASRRYPPDNGFVIARIEAINSGAVATRRL